MSRFKLVQITGHWTGNLSSQYQNTYIIGIVKNRQDVFQVSASWNYFRSGDVAKSRAGEARKQGKVNIQNASDFYQLASNVCSTVCLAEYDATGKHLQEENKHSSRKPLNTYSVSCWKNVVYYRRVPFLRHLPTRSSM